MQQNVVNQLRQYSTSGTLQSPLNHGGNPLPALIAVVLVISSALPLLMRTLALRRGLAARGGAVPALLLGREPASAVPINLVQCFRLRTESEKGRNVALAWAVQGASCRFLGLLYVCNRDIAVVCARLWPVCSVCSNVIISTVTATSAAAEAVRQHHRSPHHRPGDPPGTQGEAAGRQPEPVHRRWLRRSSESGS